MVPWWVRSVGTEKFDVSIMIETLRRETMWTVIGIAFAVLFCSIQGDRVTMVTHGGQLADDC